MEKFPCIICSLNTNSLGELHNHQKNDHSTEELSFSIICLVHYMCLQNQAIIINKNNINCNQMNESMGWFFTNLSQAVRTNNQTQQSSAFVAPASYETKENQLLNLNYNTGLVKSSIEIELGKRVEISDETFFKSVEGICKDLKVIERKNKSVKRKQSFLKPENNRSAGKKKTSCIQKHLPLTDIKNKNSQRLKTCVQSKIADKQQKENVTNKSQVAITYKPIDYSSNKNVVKVDGSSKCFQILKENNKNTVDGGNEIVGKVYQAFFLTEGAPLLQTSLQDINHAPELREMPNLGSNFLRKSPINIKNKHDNRTVKYYDERKK